MQVQDQVMWHVTHSAHIRWWSSHAHCRAIWDQCACVCSDLIPNLGDRCAHASRHRLSFWTAWRLDWKAARPDQQKTAISPSPAVCTALQLQGGQVWFYKYSYTQAGRAMIRRSAWSITRVSRHLYMLCSHVHTSQLRTNIEAQAFCHSAHNGLVYMRKLSEIAQGSGVWWTTYSLSAEVMFFLHIWESVKSPST